MVKREILACPSIQFHVPRDHHWSHVVAAATAATAAEAKAHVVAYDGFCRCCGRNADFVINLNFVIICVRLRWKNCLARIITTQPCTLIR